MLWAGHVEAVLQSYMPLPMPALLQVLYTDDLCAGEKVFFAATGVSDGDLLRGVRYYSGGASTNSIVMRSQSGTGTAAIALHQRCASTCAAEEHEANTPGSQMMAMSQGRQRLHPPLLNSLFLQS